VLSEKQAYPIAQTDGASTYFCSRNLRIVQNEISVLTVSAENYVGLVEKSFLPAQQTLVRRGVARPTFATGMICISASAEWRQKTGAPGMEQDS